MSWGFFCGFVLCPGDEPRILGGAFLYFFPTPFEKDIERLSAQLTNIFRKALNHQLVFVFGGVKKSARFFDVSV